MEPSQLVISSADLLQANVTLIAGILILLTISVVTERVGHRVVVAIVASTIPFIVSTGLIVYSIGNSLAGFYIGLAIPAFLAGLFYLVITLIAIIVITLDKHKKGKAPTNPD